MTDGMHERCALHPETGAEATCARCGSFMCAACRDEALPALCVECARRTGHGRFVAQVPILAIGVMINGGLTLLLGLYLLAFGGFFTHDLTANAAAVNDPISKMMIGILGAVSVFHIVPGALQLWAGYRLRTFRSRALTFVALGTGLATVFGCYCAPTSIAMLIWSVVVLTRGDVSARFAAQRTSAREAHHG